MEPPLQTAQSLCVRLEKRDVALHYTGAEGVTFQDAVFVIGNKGPSPVGEVLLGLRVSQEGKECFEGNVRPAMLGKADGLDAGASVDLSVFRVFQKTMPGFASKVNLFGYKAALNWSYEVAVFIGDAEVLSGTIRWSPSPSDSGHIEVTVV